VTWLTRPQMIASTWLVILFMIAMSIYIGAVDFVIGRVFGLFVGV
jgi:preprotein translocase SecE subunit